MCSQGSSAAGPGVSFPSWALGCSGWPGHPQKVSAGLLEPRPCSGRSPRLLPAGARTPAEPTLLVSTWGPLSSEPLGGWGLRTVSTAARPAHTVWSAAPTHGRLEETHLCALGAASRLGFSEAEAFALYHRPWTCRSTTDLRSPPRPTTSCWSARAFTAGEVEVRRAFPRAERPLAAVLQGWGESRGARVTVCQLLALSALSSQRGGRPCGAQGPPVLGAAEHT